jgi:hypothetical protein
LVSGNNFDLKERPDLWFLKNKSPQAETIMKSPFRNLAQSHAVAPREEIDIVLDPWEKAEFGQQG